MAQEKQFIRKVSLIIVNWNGLELLKLTMDSFVDAIKAFRGEAEIIVVDNGSIDHSIEYLNKTYPHVKTIALDHNSGFSVGNNTGVAQAKFPWVLLVNNDVKLPKEFLNQMFDEVPKLPDHFFSFSPETLHWEGDQLTDKVFTSVIHAEMLPYDFVQSWSVNQFKPTVPAGLYPTFFGTGAALLCDKEKYDAIGGFDPLFSPAYWEDLDLCFMAWRRGWASMVSTQFSCWHKVSATAENVNKDFKSYLMYRNFFLYMLLNSESPQEYYRRWKKFQTHIREKKEKFPDLMAKIDQYYRGLFWKLFWKAMIRNLRSKLNAKQVSERTNFKGDRWTSTPILETLK